MPTVTVSPKGWIVIPKHLRVKYALRPGSHVAVVDYGGVLGIVPVPADPVKAMAGIFASLGGPAWTDELVQEHRAEREREEASSA